MKKSQGQEVVPPKRKDPRSFFFKRTNAKCKSKKMNRLLINYAVHGDKLSLNQMKLLLKHLTECAACDTKLFNWKSFTATVKCFGLPKRT